LTYKSYERFDVLDAYNHSYLQEKNDILL